MQNQQIEIQKISAHLPKILLHEAQTITHKGITDTIKQGLEALIKIQAYENLRELRGKVKFSIDINELRKNK